MDDLRFTKINGVAQKSLVKLRLSDGARITTFKGRTNARVKDLAVSGGRLYIGGTFKTANGVARSALAAVDPVTTGVDWSTIRGALVVSGMTMASGRLVYATTSGTLSTVDFANGVPTGSATTLSGPAIDGQSWQSRGLLVLNLPT
jgi:hypothetical protein